MADFYAFNRAIAHWKRDVAVTHNKICKCGDWTRHIAKTPLTGVTPDWQECTGEGDEQHLAIGDEGDMAAIADAAEVEELLDAAITAGEG